MEIYKITDKNLIKLVPLFEGWEETMTGRFYRVKWAVRGADSAVHPSSAMLFIADFCFFAGAAVPGAGRQVDGGKGPFYNYGPPERAVVVGD